MFESVASSIFWFIVAIGVLVTVHEYGHFWVARKLGVKVVRFSVGFGRPLLSWRGRKDDVEYCIAAIPLGGYVKMTDEREGEVPAQDLPHAFNRQSVWVRLAVVAAGPVANFLFAIAAYWLMFIIGVTGFKPLVGEVAPDSLAEQAGLRSGQEIVAIEGRPTPTWQAFVEQVLGATLRGGEITVQVRDEPQVVRSLQLDLQGLNLDDMTHGQLFDVVGIEPARPRIPAMLDRISEDSAAQRAGLRPNDLVTTVDGTSVSGWSAFVEMVRASPERTLTLTVERHGVTETVFVTPDTVSDNGQEIGRIGATVKPARIDYQPYQAEQRFGPGVALVKALTKTWDMTTLTLRMLAKMVTLEVSVKNLSGPISIAQYAGLSAQVGMTRFLDFLAIVSISLGILNFLPVPLLDGGHLMYYCIELVRGRPVSERAQFAGQRLGVAMLVGLMGLAFYNDLARLFG